MIDSYVEHLDLQYCGLINLDAMAKCLAKTSIKNLNLGGNKLLQGYDFHNFWQGLIGSSIEVLNLYDCGISSFESMGAVISQTKIKNLNLHGNKLKDEGLKYLCEGLIGSDVEILNIDYNNITVCTPLIILSQTKIKNLSFSANYHSSESLDDLFQALMNSNVEILNLRNSFITSLKSLAKYLAQTKIKNLNLASNEFYYHEGLDELCKGLIGSSVEFLDLSANGDGGVESLEPIKTILSQTKLRKLKTVWKTHEF